MPALGRFNNDGLVDILTFVRDGQVHVGTSSGSDSFASSRWHDWFGDGNDTLRTGDVDGDGRDDRTGFTRDVAALTCGSAPSNGAGGFTCWPYEGHERFAP